MELAALALQVPCCNVLQLQVYSMILIFLKKYNKKANSYFASEPLLFDLCYEQLNTVSAEITGIH